MHLSPGCHVVVPWGSGPGRVWSLRLKQSHQQEPLEKVEDPVPRGMLSGATGILILLWELSWSSWSSANAMWAQGVAQMTTDVGTAAEEESGPGKLAWGSAFRDA